MRSEHLLQVLRRSRFLNYSLRLERESAWGLISEASQASHRFLQLLNPPRFLSWSSGIQVFVNAVNYAIRGRHFPWEIDSLILICPPLIPLATFCPTLNQSPPWPTKHTNSSFRSCCPESWILHIKKKKSSSCLRETAAWLIHQLCRNLKTQQHTIIIVIVIVIVIITIIVIIIL